MKEEDIIRMARDAGGFLGNLPTCEAWLFLEEEYLERFAALVAAAVREACAALLEENAMACENPAYRSLLQANAQAIREMGNT